MWILVWTLVSVPVQNINNFSCLLCFVFKAYSDTSQFLLFTHSVPAQLNHITSCGLCLVWFCFSDWKQLKFMGPKWESFHLDSFPAGDIGNGGGHKALKRTFYSLIPESIVNWNVDHSNALSSRERLWVVGEGGSFRFPTTSPCFLVPASSDFFTDFSHPNLMSYRWFPGRPPEPSSYPPTLPPAHLLLGLRVPPTFSRWIFCYLSQTSSKSSGSLCTCNFQITDWAKALQHKATLSQLKQKCVTGTGIWVLEVREFWRAEEKRSFYTPYCQKSLSSHFRSSCPHTNFSHEVWRESLGVWG